MPLEKRIVELEARAAFQDKLIAELEEVIQEFATRVERLESQVKDLKNSVNAAPIGPADERPPHY